MIILRRKFFEYSPTFGGRFDNGIPMLENLETFGNSLYSQIWNIIDSENPQNMAPPDTLQVKLHANYFQFILIGDI